MFVGIPILMFAWGLVTLAHALVTNKAGYLAGDSIFSSSFCLKLY